MVAAFSTGPVGLGDGPGYTNPTLALATCRADGTLLQPDKPLTGDLTQPEPEPEPSPQTLTPTPTLTVTPALTRAITLQP